MPGGGPGRTRCCRQNAATLAACAATLGKRPPADVWPFARQRFFVAPAGVRVNFSDGSLHRRRVALALGLILLAMGWLTGRIM